MAIDGVYRGDAVVVAEGAAERVHERRLARANGPANAHREGPLEVVALEGLLPLGEGALGGWLVLGGA